MKSQQLLLILIGVVILGLILYRKKAGYMYTTSIAPSLIFEGVHPPPAMLNVAQSNLSQYTKNPRLDMIHSLQPFVSDNDTSVLFEDVVCTPSNQGMTCGQFGRSCCTCGDGGPSFCAVNGTCSSVCGLGQ